MPPKHNLSKFAKSLINDEAAVSAGGSSSHHSFEDRDYADEMVSLFRLTY